MRFFIVLLVCYGVRSIESHLSIPDDLKECYVNGNMQNFHLPMNMRVLLDIIRKAEKDSYSTMDIRAMSSSLLHRFKFDGVEHYENIPPRDGVLPFGQSGKQSMRNRLVKALDPGKAEIFPFDALTAIERCTLHHAVSNTIMKENSRNTDLSCEEIGQKLTTKSLFLDLWNCPKEYGVILTPYGTIAPGVIIAAIAASLQHQSIALTDIYNITERPGITDSMDYNELVDFVLPRSEMIHDKSMSYLPLLGLNVNLDNIWLTTIAGDLAEMVVYQGPVLGADMELGAAGFWNNTMRPQVYYLKSNRDNYLDATRADIVSDIDGLIVASHVETLVNDFNSLRLSQILDMYYSGEGITVREENIRVCDRKNAFPDAVPKTVLYEQTYAASDILAYYSSIRFTSPEFFKRMVDHAIDRFSVYANSHLLTEVLCRDRKQYPRVEALIAFDGAWAKEQTMDFFATLIEDLDISMYGSKMGILHGTSGEWLLNVTESPSLAYHAVSNFSKISWPTHLNLLVTMNAVYNYLNETWETKGQQHTIGSLGQVVIILAPITQISEIEQETILKLLREIRHHHPDVSILYYVSEGHSETFQLFILSEHDRLIVSPYINTIGEFLLTMPRTLRPITKVATNSSVFQDETEDYISPSESITYMLHPQHIDAKKTTIAVHNFGYGTIEVCLWNRFKTGNNQEHMTCRYLDTHQAIDIVDNFVCTDAGCPYIYLRVQNITSYKKCAEIECKLPNQVRYIVRMQNYENSASKMKT
ncbi:PREDICTED: uncharacterized protein LOC106747566 [Dinoponera quadriceps]|uniref:Uncharacterized protein LOC106747566 n=1 Tax=Dinoponera quadriceps TaxID=609295 RepID=A0A6P3XS21_DINQU|nr:PREDICTED: uncharacterized protein LOC106747566 [Dinoponera quadriceps]